MTPQRLHFKLDDLPVKPTSRNTRWAWAGSLAVHGFVILLLSFYEWNYPVWNEAFVTIMQDISVAASPVEVEFHSLSLPQSASTTASSDVNPITYTLQEATQVVEISPVATHFAVANREWSQVDFTAPIEFNLRNTNTIRQLSESLNGTGDNAEGNGLGKAFLKAPANKKRILYVVDSSSSMNHPHNSPALTRFGRVKVELFNSIQGLNEDQEFYIIFFNDHAIPMPVRGFMARNSEDLNQQLEWVAKLYAVGRTDPSTALQNGLQMKPDLIYFLTDGHVSHRILHDLKKWNTIRSQINTVCISGQESEQLMRMIAIANNGNYTFVP
jgi:hypothetical protein